MFKFRLTLDHEKCAQLLRVMDENNPQQNNNIPRSREELISENDFFLSVIRLLEPIEFEN